MSKDTVYREDAIEEIRRLPNAGLKWFISAEAVFDVLLNLPSAKPERMKGKWIRITQGAIPEQYICPFCHRTVESYDDVEELLSIRYPYCHCGADMKGDQNDRFN